MAASDNSRFAWVLKIAKASHLGTLEKLVKCRKKERKKVKRFTLRKARVRIYAKLVCTERYSQEL